jgi:hypothetical protein
MTDAVRRHQGIQLSSGGYRLLQPTRIRPRRSSRSDAKRTSSPKDAASSIHPFASGPSTIFSEMVALGLAAHL